MENILEIKNLSKKYDSFELKNINIELPKGTIMGFIWENGAVKTTTIKSIYIFKNKRRTFRKLWNCKVFKRTIW